MLAVVVSSLETSVVSIITSSCGRVTSSCGGWISINKLSLLICSTDPKLSVYEQLYEISHPLSSSEIKYCCKLAPETSNSFLNHWNVKDPKPS